MRWIFGLLLIALLCAQEPNPFFGARYPDLQNFLQLSEEQIDRIEDANREYTTWMMQQESRIAQVHRELSEETSRTTMEPMAIGVRYVEIEGICRNVAARRVELQAAANQVLTSEQRTKLEALREALRLVGAIQQAQTLRLLGGPAISAGPWIEMLTISSADRFSRTDGTRLGLGVCADHIERAIGRATIQ